MIHAQSLKDLTNLTPGDPQYEAGVDFIIKIQSLFRAKAARQRYLDLSLIKKISGNSSLTFDDVSNLPTTKSKIVKQKLQ